MTDPTPAQQVRDACDRVSDALAIAEHPPAPKGGQGGSAGASRPPMPVSILDAKLDLKQKLVSWALMISEEAEVVLTCGDTSESIAAWIFTKADWFADHPAVEEFLDEMDECVRVLRRPYASKDERRLCTIFNGTPIYAWPWEKTITLPDGRVEQTKTLRGELMVRTLDEIAPAANVSAVLREIYDMDVPADSIRKAAKRGTLTQRDGGFQVGEVKERFDTPRQAIAPQALSG